MKKLLLAVLLLTCTLHSNAAADNHFEFLQNLTPDESEETCAGPAVTFADESDRKKLANYVHWLSNFNPDELETPAEYLELHERMVVEHPTVRFRNEKARATYLHSLGFLTEAHAQARAEYETQQQEKENKRFQKRAAQVAAKLEKEQQKKEAETLRQQRHQARQKAAQERRAQIEQKERQEEEQRAVKIAADALKEKERKQAKVTALKKEQEDAKKAQLALLEQQLAAKQQALVDLKKQREKDIAEIEKWAVDKYAELELEYAQPKPAAAPVKPAAPAEQVKKLTQQEWQQKNVIIPALQKVHGDTFVITPEILANTEEQYAQELYRMCPNAYSYAWYILVPGVARPVIPWNSPEKCAEAALAAAHKALQKPVTHGSAAKIYAAMDSYQRKAPLAQPKPAAVEPDEEYDDEYDDEEEELVTDKKSTGARVARYAMTGVNTALVTALVMCLGEISYQTMHNNNTVSFALKKIADMCNTSTIKGLGGTGICGVTSIALKDAICALYAWYRSEGENLEEYMPADEDLCTKIRSYATTAAITATVAASVVIVTETMYGYNHCVYKVGSSWGPQLPQNIPAAFLKAIQQHAYNLITNKYFLPTMAAIGFSAGTGEALYDAFKNKISAATQTVTQEAQEWASAFGTVIYQMFVPYKSQA